MTTKICKKCGESLVLLADKEGSTMELTTATYRTSKAVNFALVDTWGTVHNPAGPGVLGRRFHADICDGGK